MTLFVERNNLINGLVARGFAEGEPEDIGWHYTHADGFDLTFTANGTFKMDAPSGKHYGGTVTMSSSILDIIDAEAGAL